MEKSKIKIEWSSDLSSEPEGVIVGCSQNQECLLPWWWMNFRLHNNQPVTFIDFGDLSNSAISWCQKRGNLIKLDIPNDFVTRKEEIDPALACLWESKNSYVWLFRPSWFLKPFALLKSPYRKTVWFDLDCQVRGSIQPLYDYLNRADLAMVPEPDPEQQLNRQSKILLPDELMYNAGVIVFNHGCPIIKEWAKRTLVDNHLFMGDQQILARLLYEQKGEIESLPQFYNWPIPYGINPEAIVLHWWGAYKESVLRQIEYLQTQFLINLSVF